MVVTRDVRRALALLVSLAVGGAVTMGWLAAPAYATGPDCGSFYSGAYALGASYSDSSVTIPTCGPRPQYDSASQRYTAVYPYPGAFWVSGFQCMEFAERYLYYKFGVTMPQSTNGDQVVDHYAARYPSKFSVIPNGTAGQAPRQGDVISMSNDPGFSASNGGHVSVVQSASVNSSGNGTVSVVEENSSDNGATTYSVSAWVVKTWFTYAKWLRAGSAPVGGTAVPASLSGGGSVSSPNGGYRLTMQTDGNLVVYDRSGRPLWATGTYVANAVFKFQGDGNAVIYDPTNGFPLWSSNTYGANRLVMQDDGNLVMYSNSGSALWDSRGFTPHATTRFPPRLEFSDLASGASVTSRNGAYRLVMETGGNLVEHWSSGATRWSSQTSVAGSRLTAQSDGNTVIYAPSGRPVWAADVYGAGNHLVIQDDGNIVVYSANGYPLWDSDGYTGHAAIRP